MALDYKEILRDGLCRAGLDLKRLLLIIPDTTRTAPVGILVKSIYSILKNRVKALDILVALGTHPPMKRSAILKHLSITEKVYASEYLDMRFFNHEYDNPLNLAEIGILSKDFIAQSSDGRLQEEVPIRINRRIFDYDHLLILGPVFPHEIAGFSGGSKYFFPGISGQEIIDVTHWLGALTGNMKIIGREVTPVRTIIDEASKKINIPTLCISIVVHEGNLVGLYIDSLTESWRKAVQLSKKLHIVRKKHSFRRVLAKSPLMYDDLWTGGKCMYKCETVVEDGGELIIYAPHISSFSYTHGHILEKIGFHVSKYFTVNIDEFSDVPRVVMAVSAYIKGSGIFKDGIETPRIRVTIASRIHKEICEKAGLGYMNPADINISEWRGKEDEGILFVEKAGETLYLLEDVSY